jgi:hypothetical protein
MATVTVVTPLKFEPTKMLLGTYRRLTFEEVIKELKFFTEAVNEALTVLKEGGIFDPQALSEAVIRRDEFARELAVRGYETVYLREGGFEVKEIPITGGF